MMKKLLLACSILSVFTLKAQYGGGEDDGFSLSSGVFDPLAIYSGGNNDGFSVYDVTPVNPLAVYFNFRGGNNDGFKATRYPTIWYGAFSTDFNTAANWNTSSVPGASASLVFDPAAYNHLVLDGNRTVFDIFNYSAKNLDVNGQTFTIEGNITQSSTGKIDAKHASSVVQFAGASAQTIPSATFVDNEVNHLTVNNANHVTLSGTLQLTNALTATSGRMNAFANSPTVVYKGSSAQTIGAQYVDNKVYNLTIDNASGVSISPDSSFTVTNALVVNADKRLIIPVNKLLKVDVSVTNSAGTSGIWIQSKTTLHATDANGSFIFPQSSTVQASVNMFSKSSWDLGAVAGSKYKWQFIGIPVSSLWVKSSFYGCYVRKHQEPGTGSGTSNDPVKRWLQLSINDIMTPFTGYELVYEQPQVYLFQGTLVNSNFSQTLTYTGGAQYPGQHILSNPYTAAIDITELVFTGSAEATVYLYNTGTYADWDVVKGESGENPGQYRAVPKNTAGIAGIPRQIPSMQGFLVKVTTGTNSFQIPYATAVAGSTFGRNRDVQRAPSAHRTSSEAEIASYTVIDLKGGDVPTDKVWLFTVPGTSPSFDNGWDGRKMISSSQLPLLYAIGADGDYQISTVSNIDGTELAFKATESTTYTLTFTHHNLTSVYPELYLYDKATNEVVDITADSAKYTFEATPMASAEARFRILTNRGITTNMDGANGTGLKVFAYGNVIFVKNPSAFSGKLQLYNASGVCILHSTVEPHNVKSIATSVLPGAYLVKVLVGKELITQKIIIQ